MDPDFSELFHQSSKSLTKGHPPISLDPAEWPEEWKITYYKTYPRLPKIDLPDVKPRADFFELIEKRKSRREFKKKNSILKRDLSLVLKYSCGNVGKLKSGKHRRAYPSGGALFPVEIYPIIFRSNMDLESGLYHYNVKDHKLDVLWKREFSIDYLNKLFVYPWIEGASIGIIMTAVFSRNQNKYGERGYRHVLLEAGHIGQNIYLTSEALNLKCCAISGTYDENLEKLIDIDGVSESVVYGLVIGG